jgi:hypothetical protein
MVAEKDLYEPIKRILCLNFRAVFDDCFLATTSEGIFPDKILSQVHKDDEIIFYFLKKKNSPDLTGFVKVVTKTEPKPSPLQEWFKSENAAYHFITVEVKNDTIGLEDIYQAKRYSDLFKAKYGLLISTRLIPTPIKRLCERIPILDTARKEKLRLGQFDGGDIINWFPESPFTTRLLL